MRTHFPYAINGKTVFLGEVDAVWIKRFPRPRNVEVQLDLDKYDHGIPFLDGIMVPPKHCKHHISTKANMIYQRNIVCKFVALLTPSDRGFVVVARLGQLVNPFRTLQ